MALTHVSMWGNNGWEHITIQEAARIHPGGTVSANSGLFMCRLCRQYVSLTDGPVRDRYFKHSRGEASKNCPERSQTLTTAVSFEPQSFSPPIRLIVDSRYEFHLELGVLPAYKISQDTQRIIILSGENISHQYDINRLIPEQVTYLSIGSQPHAQYRLKYLNANGAQQSAFFNPISGIYKTGTLFDSVTRKRLPDGADVIVGRTYHILTTRRIHDGSQEISCRRICCRIATGQDWYIYEVKANEFCETAARFFMNFGHMLTENPVEIVPLWPTYAEAPYAMRSPVNTLFFLIRGDDIVAKSFPYQYILNFPAETGTVISFQCSERQQLLSTGRTSVLRYTYIWKSPLMESRAEPDISVTDERGNIITKESSEPIQGKSICIKAPYDGFVYLEKKNKGNAQYPLTAGTLLELDEIQDVSVIIIFQGLDCVWKTEFVSSFITDSIQEEKLLNQLTATGGRQISTSYITGRIMQQLHHYPKVQKWLSAQIRRGMISERAYKILTTFLKHYINKE